MDRPVLKTAFVTRGHTRALKDGRVKPRSFDCAFVDDGAHIIQVFRRMVRGLEFDISEMAITTYLCARAHGIPFTAIPVFPMRAFHHGAIVHNVHAGIGGPKDLEGRRVGVNRGYTVTTGLWARSILQHQYGVDLNRITWVLSGDEHVVAYRPPANVVPIEKGRKMEDMLIAGEIPAAIGVQVDSPDVKPLIPKPRDAGLAALRQRGLYPINHTIVIKNDVLAAHPQVAADLFTAFAEAKQPYLEQLAAGQINGSEDQFFKDVMDVIGDPLPYGIEQNRAMLDALIGYAVEQGIIPARVSANDVFAT